MTQTINHLGEPVYEVNPGPGFYQRDKHFYNIHDNGIITHINVDVINTLTCIFLAKYEELTPITKEAFEDELRKAVFNIGIFEYVK